MGRRDPVIVTGQQIGVGWTPALSVVKALTTLAIARREGLRAVYWLADEDHDRDEVASTVSLQPTGRLARHRFHFSAPPGTATGWLGWTRDHQREAEALWGSVPEPVTPDLRGHTLSLGVPLWERGLEPFSPTHPRVREPIQAELERWRSLDLEQDLLLRAHQLQAEGIPLSLDPHTQSSWFALDPRTGTRRRLERDEACPKGWWLSPGAALRPLMQSLLLAVEAVVLGPGERAYWRLTEPLWERVGLQPPRIIPRPSVFVCTPDSGAFSTNHLEALRTGAWEELLLERPPLPSECWMEPEASQDWSPGLIQRFQQELARTRQRLKRIDRRLLRERLAKQLGADPEHLRQQLFPFNRTQERVLPGLLWLRNPELLDQMLEKLGQTPFSAFQPHPATHVIKL